MIENYWHCRHKRKLEKIPQAAQKVLQEVILTVKKLESEDLASEIVKFVCVLLTCTRKDKLAVESSEHLCKTVLEL